jgi:hypothetical protein
MDGSHSLILRIVDMTGLKRSLDTKIWGSSSVAAIIEKLLQTVRTCDITKPVAEATIARVAFPEIQFNLIALALLHIQCAYILIPKICSDMK